MAPGASQGFRTMLEVRQLCKKFGGVVANAGISFHVPRGAIVGLIGPNGSGKTTLFNLVTGLLAPDSGEVFFEDHPLVGKDAGQIARLGLIRSFQNTAVYDKMCCSDNLLASVSHAGRGWRALLGRPARSDQARAAELLSFVGLAGQDACLAGELSYGQRKLLEIAMALMSSPRLLLLDEPAAGINPALLGTLTDKLRRVNTELGVTLVVIEHNMAFLMELAQQVHCLSRGRLLASGTPAQVRADPAVLEAYLGAA
jgi:branched-chain amino acid transport system ATP-binding protein